MPIPEEEEQCGERVARKYKQNLLEPENKWVVTLIYWLFLHVSF